ncbi:MAG TPA: NrfD/PsrC family molybdoenzyme membrane anchor subunit [Terriglobales bacterium]|jgi:molybdopterin-containing oxidoreductase family membrane subunit|nr:NrfD/PsrC family molybdoenzyme membrane anchor subunit [Terriglobales bacterium]
MPEVREVELMQEAAGRPPVLGRGQTYASVSDHISAIVLRRPIGIFWLALFAGAGFLFAILQYAIAYLLMEGVGIWGVNIPVAWGFAIISFVWWIGIGHAGTLISAILYLLKQSWRSSINRFAEAMTLFAVMCAGLFPLLHLGRPWLFYWLLPYPNTMTMWPNFRSPLVWDVFAVSTYFTVSLLFWYQAVVPDVATLRDHATNPLVKKIYGLLAMGWRNSARHWKRFESGYLLLAALATPLVLSVHTVVSFDFSVADMPGWHESIYPPYFVSGAIYSGFAMVLILAIPLRKFFNLEQLVTERHLDNCGQFMLATGLLVTYTYLAEDFFSWYGNDPYGAWWNWNRAHGAYRIVWYLDLIMVCLIPLLLWIPKVRKKPLLLFVVSIDIVIGMWIERVMIVIITLNSPHMPSSYGLYIPTRWDWAVLLGTVGLFTVCFLLFVRLIPMIPIFEMRKLVHEIEVPHT